MQLQCFQIDSILSTRNVRTVVRSLQVPGFQQESAIPGVHVTTVTKLNIQTALIKQQSNVDCCNRQSPAAHRSRAALNFSYTSTSSRLGTMRDGMHLIVYEYDIPMSYINISGIVIRLHLYERYLFKYRTSGELQRLSHPE